VAIAATALALTALTGLPICDAIFDCGCTWLFAGADAHCDIQRPGPPDCPICANWLIGGPFFAGLLAGWAGLVALGLRFLPRGR
jgi:hypothetical protein